MRTTGDHCTIATKTNPDSDKWAHLDDMSGHRYAKTLGSKEKPPFPSTENSKVVQDIIYVREDCVEEYARNFMILPEGLAKKIEEERTT
jgi:hypothetical protein